MASPTPTPTTSNPAPAADAASYNRADLIFVSEESLLGGYIEDPSWTPAPGGADMGSAHRRELLMDLKLLLPPNVSRAIIIPSWQEAWEILGNLHTTVMMRSISAARAAARPRP